MGFPGGSVVKNMCAMQETLETQVWSLGQAHPLGEGMASHSSILAWRIPVTEEPGGLQSMGLQRVGPDWSNWAHTFFSLWLTSLGIADSKSIHITTNDPIPFFFHGLAVFYCIYVPYLFFLLISLFFNWRIIALQNFVVFCHTSTWISHRYTYIPSLLNLPPISHPISPL